jgi:hypothetical protein
MKQADLPPGDGVQGCRSILRPLPRLWVATQTGSALVGTNELRNRKVLGPKGLLQLAHAGAGREPELLGQGVEPEAVAVMAVPAGWAWAAVADRAEVVAPLQWRRLPFGKPACVRGDALGEPVDEPSPWRVRVIQDQRQGTGSRGRR